MIRGPLRRRIANNTLDGSLPAVSHSCSTSRQVDRPERAIEARPSDIVRPTIHRRIIIRNECPEGDFGSNQHACLFRL